MSATRSEKHVRAATRAAATRRANRLAADVRRAEAVGFHARGEQGWVDVESLFSDPRYQRPIDQRRIERMASEFDPDALGVITVSDRGNGTMAVLDGFHRVGLMRHLGWGDQKMPAYIYIGLTVAEEAAIFARMNKDRRQPHPIHLFRASVTAGDPDAVALNDVITQCGLRADIGTGPKVLRSLVTADKIVKLAGPDILRRTLKTMTRAWDTQEDNLNGKLLSGMALLLFVEQKLDDLHLATRLGDFTPGMVLNKSKVTKEVNGELTHPAAVATVVTGIYNSKRRTGRLAPFSVQGWPKKSPGGRLYGYGWSETLDDFEVGA